MKWQPTDWEEIFANDVTNKAIISKTYKQLIQINIKNQNNPIKNGQKNWINIFPKRTCRWPKSTWKDAQHHWSSEKCKSKPQWGASLVAQWLRICLPMQGTWVQALVRADPTCRRATKPVHHNYWACALEPACHNYWARVPRAHALQQEKPLWWEAHTEE